MYDSQSAFKFLWGLHYRTSFDTKFERVVLTDYSAFKSSSKMIPKQAAPAVIIALIPEKNKSSKKRKKRRVSVKPSLKKKKFRILLNSACGTGLEEYNYNILLRMTSENFEEIFQLIKDEYLKRILD